MTQIMRIDADLVVSKSAKIRSIRVIRVLLLNHESRKKNPHHKHLIINVLYKNMNNFTPCLYHFLIT